MLFEINSFIKAQEPSSLYSSGGYECKLNVLEMINHEFYAEVVYSINKCQNFLYFRLDLLDPIQFCHEIIFRISNKQSIFIKRYIFFNLGNWFNSQDIFYSFSYFNITNTCLI